MSVNSLASHTLNTFTTKSPTATQTVYSSEAASPFLFSKAIAPGFGDRPKYVSRSYWSAIDINNPQKKTQITIKNYKIEHQGLNTLDITIEYSYHYGAAILNAFSTDLIYRQLNLLLLNYPNEEDFWEVMNCYLTEQILKLNPVLSEVTIVIAVHPNTEFPYYRSSTVKQTNCGSRQETWHFNFPLSFIDPIARNLANTYKVNVDYRYSTDSVKFPYPDFIIIYKQLEDLLVTSNWEPQSWLKMQHKLRNLLLSENSTLTSASVELEKLG